MMKTCEEYVLNRLEQLEERYQQLVSTNIGLQMTINEYKEKIQEIKELLNISVIKSDVYGCNYRITSQDIYDDADEINVFNRVCHIFGLKKEENDEQ